MFRAIWYRLYNLKNLRNTHGGVLPNRATHHITTENKSLPPYDDEHLRDDATHTLPQGYYKTLEIKRNINIHI